MFKKLLLKKVEEHGIKILDGLHVTFFEECYGKVGKGWINSCPLSDKVMDDKLNSLSHLDIQCDDGFKGNRGVSISFDEIISVSLNTPIGWKDLRIENPCIC